MATKADNVTPLKQPPDNLALWNRLSKTDPRHTKGFKRAGGFTGTAIKPIWIIQRLTEQFGPVGIGWGMGKPTFDLVHGGEGEVAVYCTVECWHTHRENVFVGVGGDKAVGKNKYGLVVDDEAFKKAFTDAVGNAFKFTGIGADVHMGLFDDSKYVRATANEFAAAEAGQGQSQESEVSPDQPKPRGEAHSKLKTAIRAFVHELEGCGDTSELSAFLDTPDSKKLIAHLKEKLPEWWDGGPDMPPEFIPLRRKIEMREYELAQHVADLARA